MASTFSNIGLTAGFNLPGSLAAPASAAPLAQPAAPGAGLSLPGLSSLSSPLGSFQALMGNIATGMGSFMNLPYVNKRSSFTTPSRFPLASSTTSGKPLNVVAIDDFSSPHGQEIVSTLAQGGDVEVQQYDISRGGNRLANISSSLDDVIERARNGETIDAVNLSQQDFGNSSLDNEIRRKIELLSDMDIPVAVAAGNGGNGRLNGLNSNSSFNVASTTNGVLNRSSGLGNVAVEGQTTSFATANLTSQLARMHSQGYSNGQIFSMLM